MSDDYKKIQNRSANDGQCGLYKKLERVPPELRGVLIGVIEKVERQSEESVTKAEFNELKEVVKQLVEAQVKTE
ncbi:hypothetical protein [Thermodesulforhabdus norvegica]|uniref:hypothetical protein n=1 Tax=Thermodesulforhabdus norvegica TaxID=39841 RepID=UPI000B807B46|nr:hypothetical protein [Thermodesulforhabdus norvegica]